MEEDLVMRVPEQFISEYFEQDGSRVARVSKDQYHFILQLLENGETVKTILYADKALGYVEDAAENYVQRIWNG